MVQLFPVFRLTLQLSGVELMDGSYSQDLHDRATGFSGWQP